jgi:hypothetical protein
MKFKAILIVMGTLGIIAAVVFVITRSATLPIGLGQKLDLKTYVAAVNGKGIKRTTYEQQVQQRSYFADWLKAQLAYLSIG